MTQEELNIQPRNLAAILKAALILMGEGRTWTHYALARDKHKQACRATSKHARYWDITGAVIAISPDGYTADSALVALQSTLTTKLGWQGNLHDYNDADFHTFKDVERLVTLTIDTYGHN